MRAVGGKGVLHLSRSRACARVAVSLQRPTRGGHVLQAFAAAFRTPDLRRKLLFSLAIIAVYRLGAAIPGPGVSVEAINSCLEQDRKSTRLNSSHANISYAVFCLKKKSSA